MNSKSAYYVLSVSTSEGKSVLGLLSEEHYNVENIALVFADYNLTQYVLAELHFNERYHLNSEETLHVERTEMFVMV